MHSPLHERLEYLVNYSSQLIFVSGDSIAQQQKNLEAFVFNQHDDTEIAYLTATPDLELSDYRRQLCRQLLGQQVGSYVRPLNELLADLNSHNGPILITITQSENLPDTLLQELWDLVLQSRFAGNQQHLNVLLFGQSAWAENAKHWLPAKNSDTPLLISSQSVMAQQVGSDLDQLISQRRQAFQQHLVERQQAYPTASANRLKSPWLWTGALVVFLLCFSALVTWQYGDNIKDLFAPIETRPADTSIPAPGSAYPQLDNPVLPSPKATGLPTTEADLSGSRAGEAGAPAADMPIKDDTLATGSDTQNNVPANTPNTSENQRVASWAQQVAAWDKNAPTATVNPQTHDERNQVSSALAQTPSQTEAPGTASENNFPESAVKETPRLESQWVEQAKMLTQQVNTSPGPARPQLDNTRLQALLTPDDFVLQLAGLKDEALLRNFVSDYNLEDKVWIYQTQRYGGDWHVLLFRQPFASGAEARRAIMLLPDFPRKNQAFVKSATQVLEEININSL